MPFYRRFGELGLADSAPVTRPDACCIPGGTLAGLIPGSGLKETAIGRSHREYRTGCWGIPSTARSETRAGRDQRGISGVEKGTGSDRLHRKRLLVAKQQVSSPGRRPKQGTKKIVYSMNFNDKTKVGNPKK